MGFIQNAKEFFGMASPAEQPDYVEDYVESDDYDVTATPTRTTTPPRRVQAAPRFLRLTAVAMVGRVRLMRAPIHLNAIQHRSPQ